MKRTRSTPTSVPDGRRTFRGLTSFQLHVLARHSETLHARHYKKLVGLEMRECRIIGIVGSHGEASFKHTRQDLNLCRAQVSLLLTRLIAEGLLAKVIDSTDKRTFKVALTARGRAIHRKLLAAAIALNKEWLAVLSVRQQKTFHACLETLTKSARAMRKAQELRSSPGIAGGFVDRPTRSRLVSGR
ncbi:MAG TPA: MarR family winged helix-turn-helix transcriptional regulator [Steroidobacteraceae bacterium]|nr:MarR family winged helix-turn-helix transcriptional regulator [Steroidobacteraceae bacterium]